MHGREFRRRRDAAYFGRGDNECAPDIALWSLLPANQRRPEAAFADVPSSAVGVGGVAECDRSIQNVTLLSWLLAVVSQSNARPMLHVDHGARSAAVGNLASTASKTPSEDGRVLH